MPRKWPALCLTTLSLAFVSYNHFIQSRYSTNLINSKCVEQKERIDFDIKINSVNTYLQCRKKRLKVFPLIKISTNLLIGRKTRGGMARSVTIHLISWESFFHPEIAAHSIGTFTMWYQYYVGPLSSFIPHLNLPQGTMKTLGFGCLLVLGFLDVAFGQSTTCYKSFLSDSVP